MFLSDDVVQLVDVFYSYFAQLRDASGNVLGGVVVWDVRHTHHQVFLPYMLNQPFQVLHHLGVVAIGVGFVDFGIAVLDVNDVVVNHFRHGFHLRQWHIERGLYGQTPSLSCQLTERLDEIHAQQWLTTTKTDTTMCSNEIKIVDAHLLVERFGRVVLHSVGSIVADIVQTIATMQRTALKCHECGNTFAVDADAMTRNAEYGNWGQLLIWRLEDLKIRRFGD